MGGLKTTSAADLRKKDFQEMLRLAVSGMLPKTRLRKDMLSRLKIQL